MVDYVQKILYKPFLLRLSVIWTLFYAAFSVEEFGRLFVRRSYVAINGGFYSIVCYFLSGHIHDMDVVQFMDAC